MAELSPSDVMLMTKQHCSHGQSATAIGLAAGLGGGALLLAIAAAWGLNNASKSWYLLRHWQTLMRMRLRRTTTAV